MDNKHVEIDSSAVTVIPESCFVYVKQTCKFLFTKEEGNAGYDLYYHGTRQIPISPHTCQRIPTGIHLEMNVDKMARIHSRSSYALKGLVAHGGVIDSSYRGEIQVILWNITNREQVIEPGNKVAQLVFYQLPDIQLIRTNQLSNTTRGNQGFGSSGK